jgi:hypothetical protein
MVAMPDRPITLSRSPSTRVEIQKSGTVVGWSSAKIGSDKKEKANHVSMTGLY